jgi:hypothetical protein
MNMALKADRIETFTDISFFMGTTGTRGGIVVFSTSGSGVSMDDAKAVVAYPSTTSSGTNPAGLLLNDVVNYDLTRQHINWHKDEVQVGSKVTLLRRGQVTTNNITAGVSPSAGNPAYYDNAGNLTTSASGQYVGSAFVPVGTFLSAKDADGYCKVDINIR